MISLDNPRSLLGRPVPPGTAAHEWPVSAPVQAPPNLPKIQQIAAELDETAYTVVQLPPSWSDDELRTATWNLVTMIMRPSPQYDTGELIYPVEVRSGESGSSHYSASSASGGLHTDGSLLARPPDYGILMCLSEADSGGETVLVDINDVRRHLDADDRGLSEMLAAPQPFAADDDPSTVRQWAPVLSGEPGRCRVRYLRRYVIAGWERAGRPAPEGIQLALDVVDNFVADPTVQLEFGLRRGQILLWRNQHFLHGRRAFVEQNQHRRLVRIYGEQDPTRPGAYWRSTEPDSALR